MNAAEHTALGFRGLTLSRLNPLRFRRHRRFADRATAHIREKTLRAHLRSEILRLIREKDNDGLIMHLDPRFHLRVDEADLADNRLDVILTRLNGLRYLDDICFQPGLERTLMESYQVTGQQFQWKKLPRRPPIFIRLIDTTIGFGVFAERDLEDGDIVGEYAGMISPETSVLEFRYLHAYPPIQSDEEETPLVVNALTMGNETRFVNHSEEIIADHKYHFFNGHWHILFRVVQPIAMGEQVLIDYGEGYWKGQAATPVPLGH